MTSSEARSLHPDRAHALESAGATVIEVDDPGLTEAIRALTAHDIQCVLLEGGAAVHQAAWEEDIVDYVQLYVAPVALGARGPAFLEGMSFTPASLHEQRTRTLGPDTLIEGYVHRPD